MLLLLVMGLLWTLLKLLIYVTRYLIL